MGSIRLESRSDLARRGYKVRVDCACGRVALIDPRKLLERCHAKRLGHRLDDIAPDLKCGECGKRPARIGPAFGT